MGNRFSLIFLFNDQNKLSLTMVGNQRTEVTITMDRATILLVDDDEDILTLYGDQLRRRGYQVLVARGKLDCLQQIEKGKPSLLIMDVVLGGDNGALLYQELIEKGLGKDTPVIFLSAYAEPKDVSAAKPGRRQALLSKSIKIDELIKQIECLMEESP